MPTFKKVLITAPFFSDVPYQNLKKHFEVTSNDRNEWFTEEELSKIIYKYDAVVAGLDHFSSRVLSKADKLKIIARRGIGYDKIDVQFATNKGIWITTTPIAEEEVDAVSEFTIGLIFSIVKQITKADKSLRTGSWNRRVFMSRNLTKLTVGIFGLGNIGKKVASICKTLGSNVIYYDPYINDSSFSKVDVDELFSLSDIITIHTPLTPETKGFINKKLINTMKEDSFIINTARSQIIVTSDLKEALNENRIKGAAIDVFDEEPPKDKDLLRMDNIIVTPHIAAFTKESIEKMDEICASNIIRVLEENKEPMSAINKP